MIIKKYVQSMGGYMIKIENFDNISNSGITYGGHSGSKKGIIYNNERWFLKYPKSTKSMNIKDLSYTTSPLSEYIGSHIYTLIGLKTHNTLLGIANDKVVVACKDFLDIKETILDYNSIKNDYNEKVEKELEKLSSSSNNGTELEEIEIIMNNNYYFKKFPELKDRFWDMFIIDAFISNNDRNDNNWGLILNHDTMKLRVCPVYDNGAAFYNKTPTNKIVDILNDEHKIKQVFYDSAISSFLDKGKIVNPLKYIETMKNKDCNAALLRIFNKIDLKKIKEVFDNIPLEYNNIPIISNLQKEYYYKSLEYKYMNVLLPIYKKLESK